MISSTTALLQGPSQWADVMKRKRAIHEEVINLVHQQRSAKHVEEVVVSFGLFGFLFPNVQCL